MEAKWNPQCNKTIDPPFLTLRKPFPVPCNEMEAKWNPQCNKTIEPPFYTINKPYPVPCNEWESKWNPQCNQTIPIDSLECLGEKVRDMFAMRRQ